MNLLVKKSGLVFLMFFVIFMSKVQGQVIAEVDGQVITEAEFSGWVKKSFRIGYRLNILHKLELKRHILRMYCYEKAILNKAAQLGVFIRKEDIEKEVNRLKMNYVKKMDGKIPFSRLLMERNITLTGLRNRIRYVLSVRKVVQRLATPENLKEYFKKYKKYYGGERVRASHILILTIEKLSKKNYSEGRKRRALKKIQEIQNEITSDASNFAELAKKYSESPSAGKGGDLGYFPIKGRMPLNFSEEAFALKVNQVSSVVETIYGYHLIHVTARIEARNVLFEDVQELVKKEFLKEKTELFIENIKKNSQIDIKF